MWTSRWRMVSDQAMSGRIDPILVESARGILRPYALRAIRRQHAMSGLGALDQDDGDLLAVIDEATSRALAGVLDPLPPMTSREFESEAAAVFFPGVGDLEALGAGVVGKLKKKLKKAAHNVTKGAKKIASKVAQVNKKAAQAALYVTAPTIATKLDQKKKLDQQAQKAHAKWVASGKTDTAALKTYQHAKAKAKKRTKIVRRHIETAAALTAAVVAAPAMIAAGGAAASAAGSAAPGLVDQVESNATDAIAKHAAQAVTGSKPNGSAKPAVDAAADDYAASAEDMAADTDATDAGDGTDAATAEEPKKGAGWLAAAGTAAAALLLL